MSRQAGWGRSMAFSTGVAAGAVASALVFGTLVAYRAHFRRSKREEVQRLREEVAELQRANPAHTLDLKLAMRGRAVVGSDGGDDADDGSSGRHGRGGRGADGGAAVFSIVLTGGPMGGKSSCLAGITRALTLRGYDVYIAPEIPTLLLNGGCSYPKNEAGPILEAFETGLLKLQWQVENSFFKIALATGRPAVIVYDRGLMDVRAFVPDSMWRDILAKNGWSEDAFLARYDLVLHLMSAASGLEDVYETVCASQPNSRVASIPAARDLDARLISCWHAHARHVVVPNFDDFDIKQRRALQHVLDLILAAEQFHVVASPPPSISRLSPVFSDRSSSPEP